MHDIGKIGVADNVLNKAGRLTDEAGLSLAWEKLSAVIKRNTDIHDVNIQYTKERNIVAPYGKSDNEAKRFSDRIRKECPTAKCEFLNG